MNNYQYIKEELDKQGKSISWLAKEIKVSKGYLSKLINNKVAEPSIIKLHAIHDCLDIELNYTLTKKAFVININELSIEKYFFIAEKCIDEKNDIYIINETKSMYKNINLKRFYDYIAFSFSRVKLVSEVELKKELLKNAYATVYLFNHKMELSSDINIEEITFLEDKVLDLKELVNKSILFIANDGDKLSILLNSLRLTCDYTIDDFASFKDVPDNSNSLVANQLKILDKVYYGCYNNRYYLVGNELISFENKITINKKKNAHLIEIKNYLDLFDLIINIDFMNNDEVQTLNNKIIKASKINVLNIKSDNLVEIHNNILNKMEEL